MKKNLLAFGVLAAVSTGAIAQSNVTVYGVIDAGLAITSGGDKGKQISMLSGGNGTSRLGFRGKESLGAALSATYNLEAGYDTTTGAIDAGGLFARLATVGLQGSAGSVTLGRQYSPIYRVLQALDPLVNHYGGGAGEVMNGEKGNTRMSNSVLYVTPTINGFDAQLAYRFGEVPGDSAKSRQAGFNIGYQNGPLMLKLGHNQTNNAAATDRTKNSLAMAKYNFGKFIASAGIGVNKGIGLIDSRDVLLGLTVPMGASTVFASYIRKDDRSRADTFDVDQFSVVYNYALSKRTLLYTGITKLSNTNFATTKFGDGDKEFDLGIQHRF